MLAGLRGLGYRALRAVYRALPISDSAKERAYQRVASRSPALRHFVSAEGLRSLLNEPPLAPAGGVAERAATIDPSDRPPTVFIIDYKVPEPDQDSGSVRLLQIIHILREIGLPVELLAHGKGRVAPYAEPLESFGVRLCFGETDGLRRLQEAGSQFGTVILSRPEIAYRYRPVVAAYAPRARVVFDTVDLHWVRLEREAALSGDQKLRDTAALYKKIELENASQADTVVTVTPEEREILHAENPSLDVRLVPNIHSCVTTPAPLAGRRDLLFVGNYRHAPNLDAVLYFAEQILPLVRQDLPDVELQVVGSGLPEDVVRRAVPGVNAVGFVPDLAPVIDRSRVFVAPLRYGAGMKGKVGESLCRGLPVVTTAVGAEGFGLVSEETAMIADDPADFARAVVRLCQDDSLWQGISVSGLTHIRTHFSQDAVRPELEAICNP